MMANEMEVMRVLRRPPMGKLVAEVGGKRYQKLAEVPEEEARRRLVAAIGELIIFAGGYQVLVDAGVAPPVAIAPAAAPREEAAAVVAPLLAEQQARFLESLEREKEMIQAAAVAKPRLSLSGLSRPKAVPSAPELPVAVSTAEVKPISIVDQINATLQKYVAADPGLAQRRIYLEQAESGGLRIRVDGASYERPTQIQEKDVQRAIMMALKEWEAS